MAKRMVGTFPELIHDNLYDFIGKKGLLYLYESFDNQIIIGRVMGNGFNMFSNCGIHQIWIKRNIL